MLEDKISGIYKITNLFNGCFYIGSSCNLQKRFGEHYRALRNNKHHSILLQRSVNKYGLENFTFEIIDYCNDEELLKLEQFYIDTLKPQYNICKTAGSQLGAKRSEETRKKISEVQIGRKQSTETRKKISDFQRGKIVKEETKRKIRGKNNPMYGKFGADNPNSKKIIQLTKCGEFVNTFSGAKEACDITNIDSSAITKACKGKQQTAGGFIWKYKEENL